MNDDEEVIPFEINLVRFDHPEVVLYNPGKSAGKSFDSLVSSGDGVIITKRLECSDVLNQILPPREWQKDSKFFRQKISNQPASKLEVKKLGEKLDTYLEQFKAKDVGICPVRRQLYCQCFSEIIRQVTLNCAERGYMLLRMRDEISMTINTYQKLYESIIAHWIRKALLAEQKKSDLEKKMEQLKAKNEKIELELAVIERISENNEREMAKAREDEIKRYNVNMGQLKKANQALNDQIRSIIVPKK